MYIYIHTYTRSYTHEQLFEATTRFKLTIKVTESSYLFVTVVVVVVFSQLLFALSLNAVLQFSFIAALCCARLFALRTLRMTVFLWMSRRRPTTGLLYRRTKNTTARPRRSRWTIVLATSQSYDWTSMYVHVHMYVCLWVYMCTERYTLACKYLIISIVLPQVTIVRYSDDQTTNYVSTAIVNTSYRQITAYFKKWFISHLHPCYCYR